MKTGVSDALSQAKSRLLLHFVGIGGIGMSGIAEVFHKEGFQVSGSDLQASEATQRLSDLGMKIAIGHRPENVRDAGVVVISSAVGADNPEVLEAKRLRIPVIPRAEMLGELMRGKTAIAVAGSHGKTTTTSMLSSVLYAGGLDPTVVVGGKVNALGTNAKRGEGEWVLVEADESDGSFLGLPATYAIVTNIDDDHLDHYGNLSALEDAFVSFVGKLPFYGIAAVCGDDPGIRRCLSRFTKPTVTYGFDESNDVRADRIHQGPEGSRYRATRKGEDLGEVSIQVPGIHNVRNSLGTLALALEMGIPLKNALKGLREFTGVGRRFDVRFREKRRAIVDDYAHHPTEVMATLASARQYWGAGGRVTIVFQPHRYTRTKHCLPGFLSAFRDADRVLLLEIYAAGEEPIPGISGDSFAASVAERKSAHQEVSYVKDLEGAAAVLLSDFREGDLILCVGAGTITKLPDRILQAMKSSK